MKVTLLYGPSKCGKTRAIIRRFTEEFHKNPVIIAPSSESVYYIKRLIFAETPISGFCGYRVITFDHLVNNLMEGCRELDKVNKHFLLRHIVSGMELKYFREIKGYKGFYEILSRFISELKSGEIMPEVFLDGINKKGPTDKDKEIYKIYSTYQKELHKLNIYDHEGKFWRAQQLIDNGTLGLLTDCRLLIVDGFQNFSPAELKIIKSIGKYVENIIITLTLDSSMPDIFAPTIKTYNLLKKIFEGIEEDMMPARIQNPAKIKIISCPGRVREVEEIAKEIKRLVIYNNIKPDEIAVLFRDITIYKELILEVFSRYGIPYYISEGIPLIKDPIIRTFLHSLQTQPDVPKNATFKEYAKLVEDERLLEILNNFIIKDTQIDFPTFYDMLTTIAEFTEHRTDTYLGGVVQVLDVHKARGLSFPVVFIGGLAEKEFPKQVAEEPLYGDTERAELRRFGVDVEESKEKQKEEMFLFYNAINTATCLLYLTYPSTDNEGREQLCSYYIDELKKKFPRVEEKRIPLSYVIARLEDVFTYEQLVTRIVYNYWNNIRDDRYIDESKFKDLLKKAWVENNRTSHYNGQITDKDILAEIRNIYGQDYRFSVTQFNEYGTCPFSYFCKRILGLEPIEELEDEIKPEEEGNLYHAILREYYACGGNIQEISQKYFANAEKMGIIKNFSLWEIKKEEIIKNIKNIIQHETEEPPPLGIKRKPAYFEVPFGMEGKRPLVIEDVQIQGKIDRIDLTDSGLFVIVDYKSGEKLISAAEILKGTNLQLPIYVMAAVEVLDVGTDCLEAYLMYVKRRKYFHTGSLIHYKPVKGKLKQNPLWDRYISAAKKYVVEYAEAIRNGKFPPKPKGECPSYCDYKNICRHLIIKD